MTDDYVCLVGCVKSKEILIWKIYHCRSCCRGLFSRFDNGSKKDFLNQDSLSVIVVEDSVFWLRRAFCRLYVPILQTNLLDLMQSAFLLFLISCCIKLLDIDSFVCCVVKKQDNHVQHRRCRTSGEERGKSTGTSSSVGESRPSPSSWREDLLQLWTGTESHRGLLLESFVHFCVVKFLTRLVPCLLSATSIWVLVSFRFSFALRQTVGTYREGMPESSIGR